jgi:hypothetical protein
MAIPKQKPEVTWQERMNALGKICRNLFIGCAWIFFVAKFLPASIGWKVGAIISVPSGVFFFWEYKGWFPPKGA